MLIKEKLNLEPCSVTSNYITLQGLDFDPIINFNGYVHMQSYMERLVREAYAKWNQLEEIDGALLSQGITFVLINQCVL